MEIKNSMIINEKLGRNIYSWVSVKDENPSTQGYYFVLTGNSNPNDPKSCSVAVHFWGNVWSSKKTTYWLKIIKNEKNIGYVGISR